MEPNLPTPNKAYPAVKAEKSSTTKSSSDTGDNSLDHTNNDATSSQSVVLNGQDDPLASIAPALTTAADSGATSITTADDKDVIEKEWVERAKKIVSATRDNPHQQEKEVSKLQADYLMRRYRKQVKLSE